MGAKKGNDQACNDRRTLKNPPWTDSLLGEHLHKNQPWILIRDKSFVCITQRTPSFTVDPKETTSN